MIPKAYLGDGVYACIERGMIKLTAENGIEATDTIYLEEEVFLALLAFDEPSASTCKLITLSKYSIIVVSTSINVTEKSLKSSFWTLLCTSTVSS